MLVLISGRQDHGQSPGRNERVDVIGRARGTDADEGSHRAQGGQQDKDDGDPPLGNPGQGLALKYGQQGGNQAESCQIGRGVDFDRGEAAG